MARTVCFLAAMAFLGAAPFAPQGCAQETDAAPAAEYNPLPDLPHPPDQPRSLMAPAPANVYESVDLTKPYFERDPLLDPPELPPPGWFADVDVLVAKAHVKNQLTNASIAGGALGVVRLPSAPLDWTVAPRFEIGRALPSGFGAFAVSYRFLAAEGNSATLGAAALKSRLDLNIADLDYISHEFSLWQKWDMTWRFGGRTAWIFFDSQADTPPGAGGVFEQRSIDSFVGFGPHAGVELDRRIQGTGLAFFVKEDFWIDIGRIRQGFREGAAETRVAGSQAVPVLDLEGGLRWQPLASPSTEFFVGYQYEYWWNAGRFSETPDSRGELSDQGVLVRAEFHF